jgi:class 3 adenylate cyclase/predicted ATPase
MTFEELLDQALAMLQRRGRLTYRTLQLQFQLDDAHLAALKDELLYSQPYVVDDAGRGLVWTGDTDMPSTLSPSPPLPRPAERPHVQMGQGAPPPVAPRSVDAERRQLTVMFCDLVDSTALASQLDPEDLREVVRAYQEMCAKVIARFEGHIAQYLGDGLLVYFGYPLAHEDDAQRAVRVGLGIVEALGHLNTRLAQERGVRLAVRLGIHTGLVVVGEIGSGGRQEQLALGETPNIAARLQGLAAPDTVVISAATAHLIHGYFVCQPIGAQALKGLPQPLQVYRVLHESGAQTRLDIVPPHGLTPLVGREEEEGLLQRRWDQAKEGHGQVVLLSGEAGIGKSRLVQVLKEHLTSEPHTRIEWRGAPTHQQSALSPVIDQLQRLLRGPHDAPPAEQLRTLEAALTASGIALAEAVPLLAALVSLPLPAAYPPLTLSPQRQRQHTLETLVAWFHAEAQRRPVLLLVEDLHWLDPSTLELLSLLVEQCAQWRLCLVLTARPEFHPPWAMAAHFTALTLRRLAPAEVERLATHVTRGKALPSAVLQEVVRKTDGVPLFVEELTKTVLASGLLEEHEERYTLHGPLPPLAIPATLHDALLARLDRLAAAKVVAQMGATIGRTFAYDLLQTVAPLDAVTLQGALAQLVEAEVVAQRGLPPQATYTFKHALIQDTAYQSLLKSTRQQYHHQIAQVLEAQFPEIATMQPELLAHHYTEAGLTEQAVRYWQRAGQLARDHSANLEAISHCTTGIELLKTLPETPEHTQDALTLYITLGAALVMAKGQGAPEVEHAYIQAHALCQQVGETPELVPVLYGLHRFYGGRLQLHTAREIDETLLRLAQRTEDPALAVIAHHALGQTWLFFGALPAARLHLEEAIARSTPDQHRALVFRIGHDLGVACRTHAALLLWLLGYPEQALARLHEALALAHELPHPHSLALARCWAAYVYQFRWDVPAVHEQAEAAVALSIEQGFPFWAAAGTILRGWALAMQGQGEAGMAQVCQGIAAYRATETPLLVAYYCTLLAEVSAHLGHPEDGLQALVEAHTLMEQHEERWWEAEVARLRGVLLLQQTGMPQAEAETWFQRALDVARRQQAKSLELRAAMSLSRLWQQQGKQTEARELLAPVYGWFTEGFDTADLQDAKALLEALA